MRKTLGGKICTSAPRRLVRPGRRDVPGQAHEAIPIRQPATPWPNVWRK